MLSKTWNFVKKSNNYIIIEIFPQIEIGSENQNFVKKSILKYNLGLENLKKSPLKTASTVFLQGISQNN